MKNGLLYPARWIASSNCYKVMIDVVMAIGHLSHHTETGAKTASRAKFIQMCGDKVTNKLFN